MLRQTVVVCASLALVGCGSGSSDTSSTNFSDPNSADGNTPGGAGTELPTEALLQQNIQIIRDATTGSAFDPHLIEVTGVENIDLGTAAGSVTYKGVTGYAVSGSSYIIGNVEMSADFGDNKIGGEATQFGLYSTKDATFDILEPDFTGLLRKEYDGTLTIAETNIQSIGGSAVFETTMTGVLTGGGSLTHDVMLDGRIFETTQTGRQTVLAGGTGTVTSSNGQVIELDSYAAGGSTGSLLLVASEE